MFQTELNIWLQSIGSDLFTFLLKLLSDFGKGDITVLILIIVIFGIHTRKGIMLSWIVIINAVFTDFFKNFFSLPRPSNVDSTVLLPGEKTANPTQFKQMGAKSFLGSLPDDVVNHFRKSPIDSWGFPSGHTSNATVLWGTIMLLFKPKWIRYIAIPIILLMPVSRMYLGRHFLADILGGLCLGLVFTYIYYQLVLKNERLQSFLFDNSISFQWNSNMFQLIIALFIIPITLYFLPHTEPRFISVLLGINLVYFLYRFFLRGIPIESGHFLSRLARVFITFFLFFLIRITIKALFTFLSLNDSIVFESLMHFLSTALSMTLSIEINFMLRLFQFTPQVEN